MKFWKLESGDKQAEKLKSREMNEEWTKMKDELMKNEWMKNDEGWMMKDEGWWFQAVEGFCRLTNGRTNRHLWL